MCYDKLSLWCLEPWIDHLPLHVGPFGGKSILNKLICKFDRMENNSSLICIIIYWMVPVDRYCYRSTSLCFIPSCTPKLDFKLAFVYPFPIDTIRTLSN